MSGTVFVAGATGAVGMPLVRLLVRGGWRVFGTTRQHQRAASLQRAGAEAVVVDVFDAPALRSALARVRPEVVVHQLTDLPTLRTPESLSAAIVRNARVRREGTRNLVEASLACGCRRLVAQSIAWVYASGPLPHVETDPLDIHATGERVISVQAVSELESRVLGSPVLQGVVLRYGRLYGPRTWSAQAEGDMALHVDDAANAAWLAINRDDATGIFNVSEPGPQLSTERARRELGWSHGFRLAG